MGLVPCDAALLSLLQEIAIYERVQLLQKWSVTPILVDSETSRAAKLKPFETISQLSSNQISCQHFSNQLIQTCIFLIIGVPLNSPYGEMYRFGNWDSITHYIVTICMMMHFKRVHYKAKYQL